MNFYIHTQKRPQRNFVDFKSTFELVQICLFESKYIGILKAYHKNWQNSQNTRERECESGIKFTYVMMNL